MKTKLPSYFKYTLNKNNTITLYHGMRDDNLDHLLTEWELTPKVSADAPKMLWFSSRLGDGSFSSGYRNIISIDIPLKEFGNHRFEVMNSIDVTTLKPIKLGEFPIKVMKVCGMDFTDKYDRNRKIEHLLSYYYKNNTLSGILGKDTYSSIEYLVLHRLFMYEDYDSKHKKWDFDCWPYPKNFTFAI